MIFTYFGMIFYSAIFAFWYSTFVARNKKVLGFGVFRVCFFLDFLNFYFGKFWNFQILVGFWMFRWLKSWVRPMPVWGSLSTHILGLFPPLDYFPPCFGRFENKGGNNWGAPPPEKNVGAFDGFSLKFLVFRTHKHSFGNRKCVLTSADPQNFPPAAGYGV